MALGGCADFYVGDRLDALAASRGRDEPTPAVVRRQDAVVTGEVDSGFGHQCRQSSNEIYRLEGHLRRSVSVGRLQCINHLARGTQCKSGNCYGRSGNVPTQAFTLAPQGSLSGRSGLHLLFLSLLTADPGVERETIGPGHPLQDQVCPADGWCGS